MEKLQARVLQSLVPDDDNDGKLGNLRAAYLIMAFEARG